MTQPTGVSEDARLREPDCVAEAATDAVGVYQRAIAREVLALRARVKALERAAPREMEQEKQAEVRRGWCTRCFYDVAQCTCRAGPAPAQPVRSPEPAEAREPYAWAVESCRVGLDAWHPEELEYDESEAQFRASELRQSNRATEFRVVPLYRRISEPTPSQGGNE